MLLQCLPVGPNTPVADLNTSPPSPDAILLLLILHYNCNLQHSLGYAFVFVVGWRLLTVQKWIIDLAMSLCTFISAGSKFAQLQCLWQTKDSGQISALSWSLAIYTTLMLVRFAVMALLNVWVLATVLHYRRGNSSSAKKED
ncbi:hypothetical protein CRUP_019795 [Coryphaenoides rupestris]|nr:hypothetical protein CRUP_019795 [Coryphaenoides rupestris]